MALILLYSFKGAPVGNQGNQGQGKWGKSGGNRGGNQGQRMPEEN